MPCFCVTQQIRAKRQAKQKNFNPVGASAPCEDTINTAHAAQFVLMRYQVPDAT